MLFLSENFAYALNEITPFSINKEIWRRSAIAKIYNNFYPIPANF